MDNKEMTKKMVTVLVWDGEAQNPRCARVAAPNDIPSEVWEAFNKAFLMRLKNGWFKPLEPADAYHYVAEKLIKKATAQTSLTGKDRIAYLVATARILMANFYVYQVIPARQNEVCLTAWEKRMTRKLGLQDAEEKPDTASLLEALPAVPRAADRHAENCHNLAEILPILPEHIRRAFLAYLASNGNLFATAVRLGMSKTVLYQRWPIYLRTARRLAQEVRV